MLRSSSGDGGAATSRRSIGGSGCGLGAGINGFAPDASTTSATARCWRCVPDDADDAAVRRLAMSACACCACCASASALRLAASAADSLRASASTMRWAASAYSLHASASAWTASTARSSASSLCLALISSNSRAGLRRSSPIPIGSLLSESLMHGTDAGLSDIDTSALLNLSRWLSVGRGFCAQLTRIAFRHQ